VACVAGTVSSDTTWRAAAACRGDRGIAFYPPTRTERKQERLARERFAKSICAVCPVRAECLDQAIANGERYGIWGGLTFDERRELRTSA
jgi:WhiB family transcriptional regulator, redox-sensing transcriptional regulator